MNFIKAFFIPQKMKRFRFMTIFIAIAIFVISVYLLRVPYQVITKNSKPELVQQDILRVLAFDELDDAGFDFAPIKSAQYRVVNGSLTCDFEDEDTYRLYTATDTLNDRSIRITFVFDPHNNIAEQLEELGTQYRSIYNIEDNADAVTLERIGIIEKLAFVEKQANPLLDVPAFFATKHDLTDDALREEGNAISRFSYFGITPVSTQDDYILIFTEKYIEYQIPLYSVDLELLTPQQTLATVTYTSFMDFDVGTMDTISDFGQKFASNILDLYIEYSTVQYTLQAILIIIFYPALIVIIMWLFFRRNGYLKTFKEYYNIAAISSVIPTLITFVILWFLPTMITLYGLILSVFYIFMLYRINLSPIDPEEVKEVKEPTDQIKQLTH